MDKEDTSSLIVAPVPYKFLAGTIWQNGRAVQSSYAVERFEGPKGAD